jgi:DNA polymerase-3 subunit delta'
VLAPRENGLFLGHERAEAALFAAASGPRLAHAWLIGGPRGVGKATLAFRFARFLLAAAPGRGSLAVDAAHPVFRRVAADTHADLLTVELAFDPVRKRMRTEITVDDVREISAFMRLTPAEGGWRVVVVDGAEHMNRFGANALLKVLEEPPPRAVLLLVSHTPGALLPTLRSRCRALDLAPLGQGALTVLLEQQAPQLGAEQRGRLAALADGSLGRALMLAEAEGLALAELAAEVLDGLPRLSLARLQDVADRVGRGEAAFSTFIDLLRRALASAVRQAARGAPDALGQKLASIRPLAAWSEVWHALGRLQDETEHAYLDRRQAVVSALRLLA